MIELIIEIIRWKSLIFIKKVYEKLKSFSYDYNFDRVWVFWCELKFIFFYWNWVFICRWSVDEKAEISMME